MNRFSQQSVVARFFRSRWFFIGLGAIIFLIAFSLLKVLYEDYQLKQEIASLDREVRELERRKLESLEILKYVSSERFVEEKARTELNLKKPGEKVIIVTDSEPVQELDDKETKSQQAPRPALTGVSNPLKWWYFFIQKPPET